MFLKSQVTGEEPKYEKAFGSKTQIIRKFTKEFNLPAKVSCHFKNYGILTLKADDIEVTVELLTELPPGVTLT